MGVKTLKRIAEKSLKQGRERERESVCWRVLYDRF